jgi:tRNA U38,U39,U40 pseudouridine synthase TruA
MVRAIVGSMIDIARKKRSMESVINAMQSTDRLLASSLAPATGLDLYKIYYKSPFDSIGC